MGVNQLLGGAGTGGAPDGMWQRQWCLCGPWRRRRRGRGSQNNNVGKRMEKKVRALINKPKSRSKNQDGSVDTKPVICFIFSPLPFVLRLSPQRRARKLFMNGRFNSTHSPLLETSKYLAANNFNTLSCFSFPKFVVSSQKAELY